VLASVVGEEGLSASDRKYLAFGNDFENRLVSQDAARSFDESMLLARRLLAALPVAELTRLNDAQIASLAEFAQ
jgi:V/A-type H+-transporting ATPase subunit B